MLGCQNETWFERFYDTDQEGWGLGSLGARFRESTIRARTRIEVPEDRSRTWIATIFKPRRSLDHLRFKPKSGSSCLRVGPRSLEV